MSNPLKPSAALLCKLGSVVVHADELISPDGHGFDRIALESLLKDSEVQCWLTQMGDMQMVPLKRSLGKGAGHAE